MKHPRSELSLVSRFERQVAANRFAVAVEDMGRLVNYEQLDRWSDGVCAELLSAGVVPGGYVGVCLPRDARWVAAILGVLKAGCGYVPLDPLYPPGRLALMASDSGLTTILGECAGTDPASGLPFVATPGPTTTACPTEQPPVGPDSPAYVIYTSGSSGRPKGVPISHRNVLALIDAATARLALGPTDVWSLFHSFSFDVSVWEMWGALLTGARIVLVSHTVRLDPEAFVQFLANSGITILGMVPSVFRHLVASGAGPQDELVVRQVVFAGEAVDPANVSGWLASLPAGRRPAVANMYGITEATVHVTLREMCGVDFARTEPGTLIGTPMSHVRMRLVDATMRPVAPGEVGEILLDGPGVSSGYLGRPELNRERFPTLTRADGSTEQCFRTGDLAHWDRSAGSYVYRGRSDDQVQLHGFRIELGEVETALRRCPGVYDAAVALHSPDGREPSLLAHVVVSPGARDDTEDQRRVIRQIRRSLADVLPQHMRPQHIRAVAVLPQTDSGKTDRRALVRPAPLPTGTDHVPK